MGRDRSQSPSTRHIPRRHKDYSDDCREGYNRKREGESEQDMRERHDRKRRWTPDLERYHRRHDRHDVYERTGSDQDVQRPSRSGPLSSEDVQLFSLSGFV